MEAKLSSEEALLVTGIDGHGLADDHLREIECFETLFNDVHAQLRKAIGDDGAPFRSALTQYVGKHPYWAEEAEFLRQVGRLRNILVHERTRPNDYLAVPAPRVMEQLATIREALVNPILVIPQFERQVETVSYDMMLVEVLTTITERDYSQFPVYDGATFRGLLTENGITRWFARRIKNGGSRLNLEGIQVSEVMGEEETTENVIFVHASTFTSDVRSEFARRELLEAILMTESGTVAEPLLGIATRWDVVALH